MWTRITRAPTRGSGYPTSRWSLDHAAAAWCGRVVVVGGYGADRDPLRAAFLFDGRRWRKLPCRPEGARRGCGGHGRPTVGLDRRGPHAHGAGRPHAHARPAGHSTDAAPPQPRASTLRQALGGRVYAIGGRLAGLDTNPGRPSNRHEPLDAASRPACCEAAPARPRSPAASSGWAASRRRTNRARLGPLPGDRAWTTLRGGPLRGTASASSRSVDASGRSRRPGAGLTPSGAVESPPVASR